MIKLVSRFTEEATEDINYIKIAASVGAYSLGKGFLNLWQTGGSLICRQDSWLTIYGDDFDPEELKKFIKMLGALGISLSVPAAEKLGYPFKKWNLLRCDSGAPAPIDTAPSTDEVYRILSLGTDGDIVLPERTAFMADLSHRMRHGRAAAAVYKGTVCVVPYIAAGGALICGVSAGENRGAGFAGICVRGTVAHVNKPCFVLCSDALLPFYTRFGFKRIGENAEIIFS